MNRDCPSTEDLSAYLDGEFPSAESLDIDGHLLACPECRRTLRTMRLLHQCAAEEIAPPADLLPAIIDRVQCERHSTEKGMGWTRWNPIPLALAASVIISFGAVLGHAFVHQQVVADPGIARLAVFEVVPPGGICVDAEACYKAVRP